MRRSCEPYRVSPVQCRGDSLARPGHRRYPVFL